MTYTHGLRAGILRSQHSKGIFTPDFWEVTIVGPGVPERHQVVPERPAVTIQRRTADYYALVPVQDIPAGHQGWMASGAYVMETGFAAEWREIFGHGYPVALHDYCEKPNTYYYS